MEHYVYVWSDPSGVPFYVGKGSGGRAFNTSLRSREFIDIHARGGCTVEIVDWFIHDSEAYALEVELIKRYGRREYGGCLVNKTDGGDGSSNPTVETRGKISAANTGRIFSEEHRAKLSAANRRRTQSEETRAKIRAARLGRLLSADHREKLSLGHAGKRHTDESRAKIGAAHRGRKHTSEHRNKQANSLRGRVATDDQRARQSIAQRMRGPRSGGYKGVSYSKQRKKWRAGISAGKESIHIGIFQTAEDAARAYDAAAVKQYGTGNCYLNFPEEHASCAALT